MAGGDPQDDVVLKLVDGNNETLQHFIAEYSGSDSECDGSSYGASIEVQCTFLPTLYKQISVDDSNLCSPKITIISYTGCTTGALNAFWEWINLNQWEIFAIFVTVGLVLTFLGRKLFKPVMFIAGITLTVVLAWWIFYGTFLSSKEDAWVGWVVMLGAALLGILVGFCFI